MEANIAEVVLLNIVIIIITIILVTVNQMEGNIAEVVLTFLLLLFLLLLFIVYISFHFPWLLRWLQVKSTLLDDIQKIMQEGDSREKVPHKSDSINALR